MRSFTSDALQPRLHSQFGEETSISSITNEFEPEQKTFTLYKGDSQDESSWDGSFGGYQGYQVDQESFGGYRGNQKSAQRGCQGDWTIGDCTEVPDSGHPARMGAVRAIGDSYFLSANISGFEPQEVVVLAYNQCVVIHAEKTGADGSVTGKFTHKSQLPEDMDLLSVSSTLTEEGMLVIGVRRVPKLPTKSLTPVFCSETHL